MASVGGFGGDTSQYGVTPKRKTRLRLDVQVAVQAEPAYAATKTFQEIATGPDHVETNVKIYPGQGWGLIPLQQSIGKQQETQTTGILLAQADGGSLQMAPGMLLAYGFRAPSDLTGYTGAGAWGNPLGVVLAQGDPFYQTQVAATVSWDGYNLTADQTAFPGPGIPADQPMLRVIRDTINMDPINTGIAVQFRFWIPGSHRTASDYLMTLYFSGPASLTPLYQGLGNYALVLWGGGRAQLFELTTTGWNLVTGFRWCESQRVFGSAHEIYITPHVYPFLHGGSAGGIGFTMEASDQTNSQSLFTATMNASGQSGHLTSTYLYYVPALGTTSIPPTQPEPIRLDRRIDLRPEVQISLPFFPTVEGVSTGTLLCDPFNLQCYPFWYNTSADFQDDTLYVSANGYVPSGSTPSGGWFEVDLYDFSTLPATLLTPMASQQTVEGNFGTTTTQFKLNPNSDTYQPLITLNGNAGLTPYLYGLGFQKDPIFEVVAPGETAISGLYPALMEVNATGPEADCSHETGSMTLQDPTGELYNYLSRGGIPFITDTEYSNSNFPPGVIDWSSPDSDGLQMAIQQGWIDNVNQEKIGTPQPAGLGQAIGTATFPDENWYKYSFDCFGEWQRISEQRSPWTFNFGSGDPIAPSPGQPWKVTSAIQQVLQWAGVPLSQINIGPGTVNDLPTRFFTSAPNGVTIAAGANIFDWVRQQCFDYLNAAIQWDPSLSVSMTPTGDFQGMWTLAIPQAVTFNNLAYFETDGPLLSTEGYVLPHVVDAYPPQGDMGQQQIVGSYIIKKSFKANVKRPEANVVRCINVGYSAPNAVQNQGSQTLYNFNSFPFKPGQTPPPIVYEDGSPNLDYLPRPVPFLRVLNEFGTTGSDGGLQFILVRTYNIIAFGMYILKFMAPLIPVWDMSNPLQVRPRILRWADPVMVGGVQYQVRSCNPQIKKSSQQLMYLELQSITTPFL